jgi:hypothetical protein
MSKMKEMAMLQPHGGDYEDDRQLLIDLLLYYVTQRQWSKVLSTTVDIIALEAAYKARAEGE